MKLTKQQQQDPLWLQLKEHMEAELLKYRVSNDNPEHDGEATARLRGRIAMLKDLLEVGKPPTVRDDG